MKRRLFYFLPALIGIASLVSGCGTTAPTKLDKTEYVPRGPQTFLPDAEVRQAKSLAMGSAVSKGWNILDASSNRLLVGRPLDTAIANSVTGEPVGSASVQVATDFYQRQGGVVAVVGATLITDKGSEVEKSIDFTESYKSELERSLDSLRRSWEENHERIAWSTPPSPPKVEIRNDEDALNATPAVQAWRSEVTAKDSAPEEGATTAWPERSAPVVTSRPGTGAAPVEDRNAVETPTPSASAGTATVGPEENMLVLDRTGETGVWAYYAEHYARIRGCDLAGSGAVLEEEQPEFEIHRVYCENGQSFLVKCNAGTCLGIQ